MGLFGNAGQKKQRDRETLRSYASPLIEKIRASGGVYKSQGLEIHLAREFGFCYGVERAVEYAYETRRRFSDRRVFLTDEIIHNPRVNQELRDLGVKFLSGPSACGLAIADLHENDIVIMPAFGTSISLLQEFQMRKCVLVDTTCGSVMSVWRRVESYNRDGFTSVIHGKYDHEETRATCSRAGKYLVVKDRKQAAKICEFIRRRGDKDLFLKDFEQACSPGFDPAKDLERIGFANQTTMLMSESLEISKQLLTALEERFGKKDIEKRFLHFDTICSATQERQDAVKELGRKGLDLILVIGGYKSSNTGHLAHIASEFAKTFHIEDAGCIISKQIIRHSTGSDCRDASSGAKPVGKGAVSETSGWFPSKEVCRVGVTAGASTPDLVVEEVINRLTAVAAGRF